LGTSLGSLATQFGCELIGDPDAEVDTVATLANAAPGSVSFMASQAYRADLENTSATAVVLRADAADDCPTNAIVAEDPHLTFAHIATVRDDGLLSVNPVSVLFDGSHVRVSTVKTRRKYHNLVRDPRVALSIPDPDDPSRYIEIRGHAVLEDDVDRKFVNEIARTYMDTDEYPFDQPGDERAIITIVAEQVSARHVGHDG